MNLNFYIKQKIDYPSTFCKYCKNKTILLINNKEANIQKDLIVYKTYKNTYIINTESNLLNTCFNIDNIYLACHGAENGCFKILFNVKLISNTLKLNEIIYDYYLYNKKFSSLKDENFTIIKEKNSTLTLNCFVEFNKVKELNENLIFY